jgi:hypothetical protein
MTPTILWQVLNIHEEQPHMVSRRWGGCSSRRGVIMPVCTKDGYPMVPVRDGTGGIEWGCTNLWHPRMPGPCPACGNAGPVRTSTAGLSAEAICAICRHRWVPFNSEY